MGATRDAPEKEQRPEGAIGAEFTRPRLRVPPGRERFREISRITIAASVAVATESQYAENAVPPVMTEPTPPIRLPLTQLKRGDRAVVAESTLSEEDRAVLQAMGLDERCEFTVCRASSSGPCIIQLDATRLGLSPDLAKRILTRPCDCPDSGCCAQEQPKQ